jgi:hypothetical protein
MSGVGRRVAIGVGAWLIVLGGLRITLAAPERCGDVGEDDLQRASWEAVAWFARNQRSDGRWVYAYRTGDDAIDPAYNIVRHAGVALSLAQADRAGLDGARPVLDAGLDYALENLIETGSGARAFTDGGAVVSTGASALLVDALAERRLATGDRMHDAVLTELGTFLGGQVDPDGRVLAFWDPRTRAPVPDETSPYFTGEALWALARLHSAFPEGGWDEPARRIARYLAVERDDREPRFPPVADHWASYAYDEMAGWPDGNGLTDADRAYARRTAQLFSVSARNEAQKVDALRRLTHGGEVLVAGVGTWGEGLGALGRTARADAGLADVADDIEARARCVAGLLVDRQVTADEAGDDASPSLTRGAWFTEGRTQMDDQQHALSALLAARAMVVREPRTPA